MILTLKYDMNSWSKITWYKITFSRFHDIMFLSSDWRLPCSVKVYLFIHDFNLSSGRHVRKKILSRLCGGIFLMCCVEFSFSFFSDHYHEGGPPVGYQVQIHIIHILGYDMNSWPEIAWCKITSAILCIICSFHLIGDDLMLWKYSLFCMIPTFSVQTCEGIFIIE